MKRMIGDTVLEVLQGDIVKEKTRAIVNAANSSLLGGGGVDGAIHSAGGSHILEECREIGGCPAGEARITTGGDLEADYVIHTVGPVYRSGDEGEELLLKKAYLSSLELASEKGIKSIAFPSISTGAYGYPVDKASKIAISTVASFLEAGSEMELVRFVLFSREALHSFEKALGQL